MHTSTRSSADPGRSTSSATMVAAYLACRASPLLAKCFARSESFLQIVKGQRCTRLDSPARETHLSGLNVRSTFASRLSALSATVTSSSELPSPRLFESSATCVLYITGRCLEM